MTIEPAMTAWELGRPYILRHLVLPGAAGALAGVACVGMLLACDIGGLRTLMLSAGQGWIAGPMLGGGFAVTFGSAAIGASVMAIGQDQD
jgi:hypothetical protein